MDSSYTMAVESPRQQTGSKFLYWVLQIVKAQVVILLVVAAIVNIYVAIKLAPIVHNIDGVIDKATVLYDLAYYFGCTVYHVVPEAQCAMLKLS